MFTVDLSMERVEANNETKKRNLSKFFERFVKFCKVLQSYANFALYHFWTGIFNYDIDGLVH